MDPENDNSSCGSERPDAAPEAPVPATVEQLAPVAETGNQVPPADGYALSTAEVGPGPDTTLLLRDPFQSQNTLLPLPLAPSRYEAEGRILLRPSVAATLPPPNIEVLQAPSPVLRIEAGPATKLDASQLTLAPEVHFGHRDGAPPAAVTDVPPTEVPRPAPKPFFTGDPERPAMTTELPSRAFEPSMADTSSVAPVSSAPASTFKIEPVFAPQSPVGERQVPETAPPIRKATSISDYLKAAAKFAICAAGAWLALIAGLIFAYRIVNPPMSSLMLQQWISGQAIEQSWVDIESISPQIVRAVLLSEDGRFCDHTGVDFDAMQDAIERAGDGAPRGASTISMQVTKNLFLWPSKSYVRKAIEIPLTWAMELVWPKRRIMEIYLNIAEWGPGIFGVESASQFHFKKSARRLNEREAAQLAVALPNPYTRDAGDPGPKTRRLASDIQARMRNSYTSQTSCVLTAASGR